jgi:hypothetical protein
MNGCDGDIKMMRLQSGRLLTLFETKIGGSSDLGTVFFQGIFLKKGMSNG